MYRASTAEIRLTVTSAVSQGLWPTATPSLPMQVEVDRDASHRPTTEREKPIGSPRCVNVGPVALREREPQPTTVSHSGGCADRPGARVPRCTPTGLRHALRMGRQRSCTPRR